MRKQNDDYSDLLEIQARIPAGDAVLDGDLMIPSGASGIVVFAHGSGSSRHSPRNKSVARVIREAGVGTLLFDLLTREEESVDVFTRHLRFDIELLTERLIEATRLLAGQDETTSDTIEQLEPQFLLEMEDLPGKSRLSNVQVCRCLGDSAQLGDGDEGSRAP